MKTATSTPTATASPFLRRPKTWQMASYTIQNTTKKASATPMAAPGCPVHLGMSSIR